MLTLGPPRKYVQKKQGQDEINTTGRSEIERKKFNFMITLMLLNFFLLLSAQFSVYSPKDVGLKTPFSFGSGWADFIIRCFFCFLPSIAPLELLSL